MKTSSARRLPTTIPAIAPGVMELDFWDDEIGGSAAVAVIPTSLGAINPVGGGVG